MSLKSELAEVIDWLAEHTTAPPAAPEPVPLPRDDWHLVRDNLESAVKAFQAAGDMVATPSRGPLKGVLADLAVDLGNETQFLADRAYLLGRRARPKVEESAEELAKEVITMTATNKRLTTRVKNLEAEVARLEAGAPAAQAKPDVKLATHAAKQPADYIDSGQRSLATARDNLFNVTPAEPAVLAFADDLELLNDLLEGWRRVERRNH